MSSDGYVPRLQNQYRDEVVPGLQEALGLKNRPAVPRIEKVVVNIGLGKAEKQAAVMEAAARDLTIITGQKPMVTKAKAHIAGFKLRKGDKIGLKVTLRGARMYEFLDRLISISIPRVRDFRGLPANSFDEAGNYSMGLTEHSVFPELDIDKIEQMLGMDITFVIANSTPDHSRELLRRIGMPLQTEESEAKRG